jgi:predicted dehydrogenase
VLTRPLRVALIGCGRAAERLWVPALHAVPGARLVAVVDPRPERRALIARAGSADRAFERADELFTARQVDAAIVATPAESHAALVRLGIAAGIPLLVEKPLATTLAEATEICALAQGGGTPMMVGFNRRWWPPAERLRELLLARQRSESAVVEMVFVGAADRWVAIDGSPDLLNDLGSHQLDLLRFLFDADLQTVSARQVAPQEIHMVVRVADGSAARCRIAHAGIGEESVRVAADGRRYRIHGSSSLVAPADGVARLGLDFGASLWRRATGIRSPLRSSFERELRAFVASVRSGAAVAPGVTDGAAAVRAVAAARESLERDGLEMRIS